MNIYLESFKIIILTYLIFLIPLTIFLINKKLYNKKETIYMAIFFSVIYGIVLSAIIYIFPNTYFSLFTNVKGIINCCTYACKILFFSSSVFGIQIIIPIFYYFKKIYKKTALLFLLKITVLLLLIFILYKTYHINGILYAIPLTDLIIVFIYFIILKIEK